MSIRLYQGDNRDHLRTMIARGEFVHACITDPPYSLESIVKRFGKQGAAPAKFHRDGAFSRASKNFEGQQWDASGIERDPEFWKLVNGVMLPGAYLIAFSSPRTYHQMTSAIEAAGFVIHPLIGWAYGNGMPKHHSAARAGEEWQGWSYGGQARKPALEPICVAQKPFSTKTGIANIQKHGVGAVNIDACRPGQRWPANLITDGTMGHKFEVFEQYEFSCYRCEDLGYVVKDLGYGDVAQENCPVCDGWSGTPFSQKPVFYMPKADKSDRAGSSHPTVKPIALMQSLIRHVTPKGGTVLDMFAGSGTTGQAARNEGVNAILMEMEKPYAEFIRRRLALPLTTDDLLGEIASEPTIEDLL